MTDDEPATGRAYAAAKSKVDEGLFELGQAARAFGDYYARRAAFREAAEMAEAEADNIRRDKDDTDFDARCGALSSLGQLAAAYRAKAGE